MIKEFLKIKVRNPENIIRINELELIIKNHIENWKRQCKYDIPFDYIGLFDKINYYEKTKHIKIKK